MEKLLAVLDRGALAFIRETERLIDRGYVAAWFTWLEWIAITSVVWAIGFRVQSWVLLAVGASSTLLLVLTGVIALQRIQREYIEDSVRAGGASFVAAIATALGTGATYVLTKAVMALLPAMGE